MFISEERYPTRNLRVQKTIPDVFEYFFLRAGAVTLIINNKEVIHLYTILNKTLKEKRLKPS